MDNYELLVRQVLFVVGVEGGVQPGSFNELIIKAFLRADQKNFIKLSSVYPTFGNIITSYRNGTLKTSFLGKAV